MFLFLFARTKKRSDEIAKFQFLIPANGGVATILDLKNRTGLMLDFQN